MFVLSSAGSRGSEYVLLVRHAAAAAAAARDGDGSFIHSALWLLDHVQISKLDLWGTYALNIQKTYCTTVT